MSYRRARPAPRTVDEAIAIATPLIGDVRLREEEHEAIAMLIKHRQSGGGEVVRDFAHAASAQGERT